jgi:hypothetical protein
LTCNGVTDCWQGIYEPGKRHWLKVKKDYLADGAMADSADLVVLGAYFGTGSKGAALCLVLPDLLIFLMAYFFCWLVAVTADYS